MCRLLLFMLMISCCATAQELPLSWTFKHPVSGKWIPFGTHGSVQESLMKAGELPDPFVGENENKFTWIERYNWEFAAEFTLTKEDLGSPHLDIELPNVDTYAKIYINNKYIGSTENTYVIYRFDIKKQAKAGVNKVKLVFESPVAYQKKHMAEVGVILPSPNDLGEVSAAPYCRKPQYQFGWDWALRITTIGMWKPVKIIAYGENRVTGTNVSTREITETNAVMDFSLVLREHSGDSLIWSSKLFGQKKVKAENGVLRRSENIASPQLWWPRGHGAQDLYTDQWTLSLLSGEEISSGTLRFGIRKSELIQAEDQWGTSYTIRINGRDIFCKGANYIPQDIFPARVTDAQVRNYVSMMKESNLNIVRVWGGGYYPGDAFYEACDESGIMVWQDFMFACAMYPGNPAFLANVQKEFDQQVPRIASHPSVVLFNGNNEVDVAWKNWGFVEQYKLKTADIKLIDQYYAALFKGTIPATVAKWTDVPYVHTSPLSNWGKDEYFNHGTMHYWGVWHGKDPIEDFGRKTGRFNSEYGFQSFPEFSTLLTFSDTSQWSLTSKVMKHHQKSYVGNGMIEKHANILYGRTTDFRRFVYYSQLTQATAVSMAISGHRTGMPRCSGTIFWQLNDCWPAPTWSGIDYFGNWKALQYVVRDDFRDVAVLAKVDTIGRERFHLVSDVYAGFPCKITAEVLDLAGTVKDTFVCNLAVMEPRVQELFALELAPFQSSDYHIRFSWNDQLGTMLTRNFTHTAQPRVPAPAESVRIGITSIDPAAKTAVIVVKNTSFVRNLWVYSAKTGITFDRNFIDLLPGKHEIIIHFEELPSLTDFQMMWL